MKDTKKKTMMNNERIKNTKILVVDDDSAIGDMLKMLLEMNGYEVTVSEKPDKTEEIIQKKNIDLVILDMLISGVNGTDVCKRIKNNKKTAHAKVLMISALHNSGPICKAAGADEFIAKPFEIDDLLSVVEEVLKGK